MRNKKRSLNDNEIDEVLTTLRENSEQFEEVCEQLKDKIKQIEFQQKFMSMLEEKVKANSILITKLYSQMPNTKSDEDVEGYS